MVPGWGNNLAKTQVWNDTCENLKEAGMQRARRGHRWDEETDESRGS